VTTPQCGAPGCAAWKACCLQALGHGKEGGPSLVYVQAKNRRASRLLVRLMPSGFFRCLPENSHQVAERQWCASVKPQECISIVTPTTLSFLDKGSGVLAAGACLTPRGAPCFPFPELSLTAPSLCTRPCERRRRPVPDP